MKYRLNLSKENSKTINFIGSRYEWSDALLEYTNEDIDQDLELGESEVWQLNEAFNADTVGGHSHFPMLDNRSDLAEKLYELMDNII